MTNRMPLRKRIARWIERSLAVVGVVALLHAAFFDVSPIVSESMAPTLKGTSPENGDWILSETITSLFRSPCRWEVIAIDNNDGVRIMKRVVGLPGETVAIADGRVVVNGRPITPPAGLEHLAYYAYGNVKDGKSVLCDGGYYVLGDNTVDSYDSRFDGLVPPSRIRGHARLRVWPPSRWGFVNP